MAELIAEARRKRQALQARFDMFARHVDILQTTRNKDQKIQDVEIMELEQRIPAMENILYEFNEIQEQIEVATENTEEEYKQREEFERLYYRKLAEAKLIYLNNSSMVEADKTASVVESKVFASAGVQLPKINLPTFKGSYDDWMEFRDLFQSLVHENISVDPIQKFHYLRLAVKGSPAAQVIQSIEFSAQNYTIAWELLCERYNKKTLLINNHVKALFNLPQLIKEGADEIRNLTDVIVKNLRSLQVLNQPTDKWDVLLVYMITKRLDRKTAREWEESRKLDEVPTVQELIEFLQRKAELLEVLHQQADAKGEKTRFPSARAFVTTSSNCSICNGTHGIFNCDKFLKMTPMERSRKARSLRLCINCLKLGHHPKNCNAGRCRKCNAAHNTLLHFEANNGATDTPIKVDHVSDQETNKAKPAVTLTTMQEPNQVLLSTALVQITDSKGRLHTCRVLLDSGSQLNFITRELCNQLQLKPSKYILL